MEEAQKKPLRRVVLVTKDQNRLYQFMKLMNSTVHPEENRLTPRELDILYSFYESDPSQINKESKDHLMERFNFSSKTQIGAYIAVLFRKGAIYRNPTKAWVYHFNNLFFPSGNEIPSEIVIRLVDGKA